VVNNRRAAVLTVLTGVYVVLVCLRFPLASAFNPSLGLVLGAVLVEEILFRPLLIDLLRKALAGAGNPLRLAVVGSAVIWALVHIPSKPPLQVVGIFIGGLLFGALYAFSRSNIVGFVVHATANAGSTGGLLMFGLCLLLAPLTRRRRTSAVPGEMRPA
jgi:membrane protease YdiL (CAAX protease family)